MFDLMSDLVLETIRTLVLLVILVYLWRAGTSFLQVLSCCSLEVQSISQIITSL